MRRTRPLVLLATSALLLVVTLSLVSAAVTPPSPVADRVAMEITPSPAPATPVATPGGVAIGHTGWHPRGAVRPLSPPSVSGDPSTPVPAATTAAADVSQSEPTAAPTPVPTEAATPAPPTPVPPPPGRCPTPMPAEPPAGWQRVTTSDFNETTPLGSWPGPEAAVGWKNRLRGPDSSGRGTYDSSKTISEAGGILDVWIHSEGDTRYVAAPVSNIGATAGARISVCMRADVIPGYKVAFLLWPTEGEGNSMGEIDYPEMKLDGPPATANAFMHYAPEPKDGRSQDWYDSGAFLQDWHTYTIEWNPKASPRYVRFYVDGRLIGESTEHVPWVPMFYVMQIETYLAGQPLPPPAQGHVQIDWATIEVP